MHPHCFRFLVPVVLFTSLSLCIPTRAQQPAEADVHWPSFRGLRASGVAGGKPAPITWTTFKWKTPIPGLAHSAPVIWGDRLFVTTAVSENEDPELKVGLYGNIESVNEDVPHSWKVFCLDKKSGKILWEKTAHTGVPRMKRHPKSTHANCTPATDGKRLVAFFGAEGLYCYDVEGELQWKKDFGPLDSGFFAVPNAQWGFASSPVIHEGKVFVQCDVQKNSFIAALDLETGKELWRTPREDVPTWSTPTVDVRPGRAQVVANGYKQIAGYDLHSGKELWRLGGAGDIPVPTPIVAHELVFITSAHGRLSPIFAIRANAAGDISLPSGQTTNEFIAWSIPRGGNYMQTPIVVGDHLFAGRDHGVVTCFDARTGEQKFSERLGTGGSGFTASPVASGQHLYFTSEQGVVYVLEAKPEFKIVATNDLKEICMATPALSEGEIFFRLQRHVACVGQEK